MRSVATGAWKRTSSCDVSSFCNTPGCEEFPPSARDIKSPSVHEKAVNKTLDALIAPTRHLHRPMSPSIRPMYRPDRPGTPSTFGGEAQPPSSQENSRSSRGGSASQIQPASKAIHAEFYDTRAGRIRPASAFATDVYTPSIVSKNKANFSKLRPQSAHPAARHRSRADQALETDDDDSTKEASAYITIAGPQAAEAPEADTKTEAYARKILEEVEQVQTNSTNDAKQSNDGSLWLGEHSVSHLNASVQSWTATHPKESSRPFSAPAGSNVHLSGSRSSTSSEAFEEWNRTRKEKFRNQQIKSIQEYRKGLQRDRSKRQSREGTPEASTNITPILIAQQANHPPRLNAAMFKRPATASSVLQNSENRGSSHSPSDPFRGFFSLLQDSSSNRSLSPVRTMKDSLLEKGRLRVPPSSKPEYHLRVFKVIDEQEHRRDLSAELRRRRVEEQNKQKEIIIKLKKEADMEAKRHIEQEEKRRQRNQEMLEEVRMLEEEEHNSRLVLVLFMFLLCLHEAFHAAK